MKPTAKRTKDSRIVRPRKWGNSLGVVLPKEQVEQMNLKEGEPVIVTIARPFPAELFGSLPRKRRMTAQRFKDEARAGWDK
jgi:antitoxin component of MazEF toxin-antitoxin module